TFDPALALAAGISPALVHQLLMALVSVTVVGAFDSVGAILVVAFLAGPAATAYLLTDRLAAMLMTALAVGVVAALGGYGLAVLGDLSIAGTRASVVGALFVLALLLAPRRGLLAVTLSAHRRRRRLRQALLAHARGSAGPGATAEELARRLRWPLS